MEIKVQVPFQQLLSIVKNLSLSQKAKLREELNEEKPIHNNQDDFINYLLDGPVYSDEEIQVIEDNTKSITEWRTTN